MLTVEKWTRLITDSSEVLNTESVAISFRKVREMAWDYISKTRTKYNNDLAILTEAQNLQIVTAIINDFIVKYKPIVSGFEMPDGKMNFTRLRTVLVNDICDWGPLSDVRVDPDITEIRIRDYNCILVERRSLGYAEILKNPLTGKRIQFDSCRDVFDFANKLLRFSGVSVTMALANSIGNGITPEGYRVAVIGPGPVAPEKGKHYSRERCTQIVIRKFSEDVLTPVDIVHSHTASTDMMRCITIVPKTETSLAFVGPTGSGKTVNLQIAIDSAVGSKISMEINSELRIRKYNSKGELVNDATQYEIYEKPETGVNNRYPTARGLQNQIMRMSPHIEVFGEARDPEDFSMVVEVADTGHIAMTTWHAFTIADGIKRAATAVQKATGMDINTITETICNNIGFMISVRRVGLHRRMLELGEVSGVKWIDGHAHPVVNIIYKFKPNDEPSDDMDVHGAFYKVGNFSQKFIDRLRLSPISKADFDFMVGNKVNPQDEKTWIKGVYDEAAAKKLISVIGEDGEQA